MSDGNRIPTLSLSPITEISYLAWNNRKCQRQGKPKTTGDILTKIKFVQKVP